MEHFQLISRELKRCFFFFIASEMWRIVKALVMGVKGNGDVYAFITLRNCGAISPVPDTIWNSLSDTREPRSDNPLKYLPISIYISATSAILFLAGHSLFTGLGFYFVLIEWSKKKEKLIRSSLNWLFDDWHYVRSSYLLIISKNCGWNRAPVASGSLQRKFNDWNSLIVC